jgi:putative DNA primase/helicase
MTDTEARLDALFQQHGVKTEEVQKRDFQDLLEEAESFTPEYDPQALTNFFKDVALARLEIMAEERIFRALKRSAKVPAATAKLALAKAKGKAPGSSAEDFGRLLCNSTLARHFANGQHIKRIARDYFTYNGKFWERRSEDQIAWYVIETLQQTPNPDGIGHSNALSQAQNLLRGITSPPDDPFSLMKDPPNVINVQNGELWVNSADGTVQLLPHAHTSYQLSVLETHYDPYATCPLYDNALATIFAHTKDPEGMVRHWHEFVGYIIQTERDIASWWLLKGQGSNGKTKLIETVMKLLGPTGTATMKIEDLGERFAVSDLIGKKMMLEEDMNKNAVLPDGLLKSISERKVLTGEHKGKDRFAFICRAVPVMLSNHFPRTSDFSHGMLRRANVIPFTRQFKGAEADSTLFPRIWAQELPGVLNRALQGLQRLRQRGGFLPPIDCIKAVDVWATQANPAKAFLVDCLEPAPECRIPWKEVYRKYVEWAEEENLRFKWGRNTFKRELQTLGVTFRYIDGYHHVVGYGWRRGANGYNEEQE